MADVLEVLRRLDSALLSRRATAHECGELHDAIDRVAELVAADEALDRINAMLPCEPFKIPDPVSYLKEWESAHARRAAALAAVKGGQ